MAFIGLSVSSVAAHFVQRIGLFSLSRLYHQHRKTAKRGKCGAHQVAAYNSDVFLTFTRCRRPCVNQRCAVASCAYKKTTAYRRCSSWLYLSGDSGDPRDCSCQTLTLPARRAVCAIKSLLLCLPAMQWLATKPLWLRYCRITCQGSHCVNAFLAAILGLVLPFVCWGAEATPGHPHLRAHFVFMTPETFTVQASANSRNAQSVIQLTGSAFADGLHALCSAPIQSAAPTPPTGQSTPQTLAITLLLLAVFGVFFTLQRGHGGGFPERFSTMVFFWLPLDVATPPPRSTPLP